MISEWHKGSLSEIRTNNPLKQQLELTESQSEDAADMLNDFSLHVMNRYEMIQMALQVSCFSLQQNGILKLLLLTPTA